ncbi:MAG: peroxiredoxin [Bdellovibrio sp. CG10_big_fil_rev_8_21_14_0_10_47_8]|nr:MAG: peroxiredoxin [Bdellovibrio sp. CG10_big_fil_rev_8_21_14_0_10_47_8]
MLTKNTPAKKAKTAKTKPPTNYRLNIGEKVPDFSLPATGDSQFNLSDFKGKKIVLYFYPKDSTPGCTVEGLEFSALLPKFKRKNTLVFGISRDSLKSHENFKCKQSFSFDLLSDQDETACEIFEVIKEKNMYGKKVMGIERSTFVIDEHGKLLNEWRKVKAEGHAQEVLESL